MTRTALTAVVAAALSLPSLAAAAPKPSESAQSAAAEAPTAAPARAPRYCVVQTYTGSRIPQRTCKTLDAWLAEGTDPRVAK